MIPPNVFFIQSDHSRIPEQPRPPEKTAVVASDDFFLGSPEEEQLQKLGEKIDASGWLTITPTPYTDRTLEKESILFIKNYLVKPFVVSKVFSSQARAYMKRVLNSSANRQQAKENGKENKLDEFLKLPLLTEENDVLLRGEVCLAKLLASFLAKSNDDAIKLKGGMARHLVLPWVLKALRERLDHSLEISPERQQILSSNRPDWDFVKYTPNASHIPKYNQHLCEDLVEAIFGKVDPDWIPYYAIIVQKIICRSSEANDGLEHNENVCLGSEGGPRVDITQQQSVHNSQLFELHGFDINIQRSALARWWKNPKEKVTAQDLKEVTVSTDRVSKDDGLQSCIDLGFGILHSHDHQPQKSIFARYIYWITQLCRSYESYLRTEKLTHLIQYQKNQVGKIIGESILGFHTVHNMGNSLILKAMIVNTLVSLKEELGSKSPDICNEFLQFFDKHLNLNEDAGNIFTRILLKTDKDLTLDVLKVFAFINTLGMRESGKFQASITRDGHHLQITDRLGCVVEFQPNQITLLLERTAAQLENYPDFYERILKEMAFDPERLSQMSKLNSINWVNLENSALSLLSNNSDLKKKIGFLLLIICSASQDSVRIQRELVKHFPSIIMRCQGNERDVFKQHFELALRNSDFQHALEECLNRFDLISLETDCELNQEITFSIAAWDPKLALDQWNAAYDDLSEENRLVKGKRLIDTLAAGSPQASLTIFRTIQHLLPRNEEIELFILVLTRCLNDATLPGENWNTIARLQKTLLTLLKRPETLPSTPITERKRVHGKKKTPIPSAVSELADLSHARAPITRLVIDSLKLCPDQEAFDLLELAAQKKLIENSGSLLALCETLITHPQGGKKAVLKLWKTCHDSHVAIPAENLSIALKLCEDFIEDENEESAPLLEQLLPFVWSQVENKENQDERGLKLLQRKLDRHVALNQTEELQALLDTYSALLPAAVYIQYVQHLFARYLGLMNLQQASDQLTILYQHQAANQQIHAFLIVILDNMKNANDEEQRSLRPSLEQFIAIGFDFFEEFNPEELSHFLDLCGKLLDNPAYHDIPISKSSKEKIKAGAPRILECAHGAHLTREIVFFLKHLHFRQMLPAAHANIIMTAINYIIKEFRGEKSWIEFANQLIQFYKFDTISDTSREFSELYRMHYDVINAMLALQVDEHKWNQKLYEKILHCLDITARTELAIITPSDIYRFTHYFMASKEHDAETILVKASPCERFVASRPFDDAYALLAGYPGNLERSTRLLLQQKDRCLRFDHQAVQMVVQKILTEVLKCYTPQLLKNAISCLFVYDITFDYNLVQNYLSVIAKESLDIIDHTWECFDQYYKRSFRYEVNALFFYRLLSIFGVARSSKIEMAYDRFYEFYEFSIREETNPEDYQYFKSFKRYLSATYPDHELAIANLTFNDFRDVLTAKKRALATEGKETVCLTEAHAAYANTVSKPPQFYLANKLFWVVLQGYAEKSLHPTVTSEATKDLRAEQIRTAARCTQMRFDKRYAMITPATHELMDNILFELMLHAELEDQAIEYFERLIAEKNNHSDEIQKIILNLIAKIPDCQKFPRLIKLICEMMRRNPNLDIYPILSYLMLYKSMDADYEAYEILRLHLLTVPECPSEVESPLITELIKRMLMSNNKFESACALLLSKKLKQSVTEQDYALLWGTYFSRRLNDLTSKNAYRQLAPLVHVIIEKRQEILPSKAGVQLVFEAVVRSLMCGIEYQVDCVPENLQRDHIARELMCFSHSIDTLIKTFSDTEEKIVELDSSEENLKAVADKYCHQMGIADDDYYKGFFEYDNKIYSVIDLIIELSKRSPHDEMRHVVLERYPFLHQPFTIHWKSARGRALYFDLSKCLINYLAKYEADYPMMKILIQHMIVVQSEFLMYNFPEHTDDIVELLHKVILTSPVREFDYVQRLSRYLIVKLMLCHADALKTHSRQIFEMLIFTVDRKFDFPFSDKKLDAYAKVIQDGLQSGVYTIIKRSLEMLNEIPASLIHDKSIAEYAMLLKIVISNLTMNSDSMLFVKVPEQIVKKDKTFHELFLEIFCSNPFLSGSYNRNRNQLFLSHAGVVAHSYLTLLMHARNCLSPNTTRFTTEQLHQCFVIVHAHGFFEMTEETLLGLIPHLKKFLMMELSLCPTVEHFFAKLVNIDLIEFLTKLNLYKTEAQKERIRLIQEIIGELIDLIVKANCQKAAEFLWNKYLKVNEELKLAIDYRNNHNIIIGKLDRISKPKVQKR